MITCLVTQNSPAMVTFVFFTSLAPSRCRPAPGEVLGCSFPGSAFLRCAEGPAAAEGSAALSRCGGPGPGFGFATVCATPSAGSSAPPVWHTVSEALGSLELVNHLWITTADWPFLFLFLGTFFFEGLFLLWRSIWFFFVTSTTHKIVKRSFWWAYSLGHLKFASLKVKFCSFLSCLGLFLEPFGCLNLCPLPFFLIAFLI